MLGNSWNTILLPRETTRVSTPTFGRKFYSLWLTLAFSLSSLSLSLRESGHRAITWRGWNWKVKSLSLSHSWRMTMAKQRWSERGRRRKNKCKYGWGKEEKITSSSASIKEGERGCLKEREKQSAELQQQVQLNLLFISLLCPLGQYVHFTRPAPCRVCPRVSLLVVSYVCWNVTGCKRDKVKLLPMKITFACGGNALVRCFYLPLLFSWTNKWLWMWEVVMCYKAFCYFIHFDHWINCCSRERERERERGRKRVRARK